MEAVHCLSEVSEFPAKPNTPGFRVVGVTPAGCRKWTTVTGQGSRAELSA